jgi:3-hydroxybutyryl-CoA dehydrogenase
MSNENSPGAPPTFSSVVVVGAGVMGSAIGQVLAVAGLTVVCVDRSRQQLETAQHSMRAGRYGLERAAQRGKISVAEAEQALRRLTFSDDLEAAASHTDLVIEAVPEDLDVKLHVFERLGKAAAPRAVLASNTSGLPLAALAAASQRPERVLAWHWASPAQVSRFAEIATTPRTADWVVRAIVGLAEQCGKEPVVIAENPRAWGFVANRIFFAAVREAERVRDEGLASEQEIDTLMRNAYAWPSGPFGVVKGATEGWGDDRRGSVATLL